MSVHILCEGPICNEGRSAKEREEVLLKRDVSAQLREDAYRSARSLVSKQLTYTPHNRVGTGPHGTSLFACGVCGFERVYGNTFWAA